MHVEKALNAIKEWYEGEDFEITGITDDPKINSRDEFDQSEHFLSVVGFQESVGDSGDSYRGGIYFEYEKGKFIATKFWV